MSGKIQCAKSIRNLASMFKDMVTAAEVLEQLGSVEQSCEEASTKLQAIRADVDAALAEKVVVRDEITLLRETMSKEYADAQALVSEMVAETARKTEIELVRAKQVATDKIVAAESRAEEIIGSANEARNKLITEINELVLAQKTAKVDAEAAGAELESLRSQIAQVKDQLKALIA